MMKLEDGSDLKMRSYWLREPINSHSRQLIKFQLYHSLQSGLLPNGAVVTFKGEIIGRGTRGIRHLMDCAGAKFLGPRLAVSPQRIVLQPTRYDKFGNGGSSSATRLRQTIDPHNHHADNPPRSEYGPPNHRSHHYSDYYGGWFLLNWVDL